MSDTTKQLKEAERAEAEAETALREIEAQQATVREAIGEIDAKIQALDPTTASDKDYSEPAAARAAACARLEAIGRRRDAAAEKLAEAEEAVRQAKIPAAKEHADELETVFKAKVDEFRAMLERMAAEVGKAREELEQASRDAHAAVVALVLMQGGSPGPYRQESILQIKFEPHSPLAYATEVLQTLRVNERERARLEQMTEADRRNAGKGFYDDPRRQALNQVKSRGIIY